MISTRYLTTTLPCLGRALPYIQDPVLHFVDPTDNWNLTVFQTLVFFKKINLPFSPNHWNSTVFEDKNLSQNSQYSLLFLKKWHSSQTRASTAAVAGRSKPASRSGCALNSVSSCSDSFPVSLYQDFLNSYWRGFFQNKLVICFEVSEI